VLRPIEAGDAERFDGLNRSPVRDDITDARAWIARARLQPGALVFSLVETAAGQLVGGSGVAPLPGEAQSREFCLWVAEPFSGRGYGSQATRAIVDLAFGDNSVQALWIACRPTNERARRMIERCGFSQMESAVARSVALRAVVPIERYRLERRNWQELALARMPGAGYLQAGTVSHH
jgi:RimJ/RimL family protein N-acetyltransferase